MPLPPAFSPTEHLQDAVKRLYNRQVANHFRDLGPEDWPLDISSPRSSLRTACTHQEQDTAIMSLMRMWLFDLTVRREELTDPPIYGIPTTAFQAERKFRPQVMLYFKEDRQDVEPGFEAVEGRISFRIQDESTESITMAKLTQIAQRIKSNFAPAGGYIWRKGREMFSYSDWDKGYQLQILARSDPEARALVDKVLNCQSHTPDMSKFNRSTNAAEASAYPTIPPTRSILGNSERLPRRRAVADVRFQYAIAHIHGRKKRVCLVDLSGRFNDPLVAA